MIRRILPFLSGYLFAVAANFLALVLTHFLSPLLVPSPFPIFVAAIVLSAWFYGAGVGLFSTLLATLVTNYFFLPPLYVLTLGKDDVSRLGLFLLVTGIAVSMMQAQRRAAEAQSHLGAIVAYSDDAIIGLTLDGSITSWNTGAVRIYGFSAAEIIGHSISDIIPAEYQTEIWQILSRVHSGEATQQFETFHLQKSGRRIDVSITISPIRKKVGQISGASMITRDITDRKLAERKLQEYTEQLHFLSQRLVEVQENERRSIARELHDEIGQILTGLKLIMEVAPRLPAEAMSNKLVQAQALVTELIEQVSHMTLDLRPPMLDDLGLLPTLLWHFNRYSDLTQIQVQFKHVGIENKRFSTEIETAAYRIVQEALTNVARHTSAKQVKVWVVVDSQGFNIQIFDNGEGFDSQSTLLSGKASGLVGIRERAELLDGTFTIQSEPGQGTHLEVVFPFERIHAPAAQG
jgi:PAS domain S-box-containing protein